MSAGSAHELTPTRMRALRDTSQRTAAGLDNQAGAVKKDSARPACCGSNSEVADHPVEEDHRAHGFDAARAAGHGIFRSTVRTPGMMDRSVSDWDARFDDTMRAIRERVGAILTVMDRYEARLRESREILQRLEALYTDRNRST
jgi:hypothetical protein